MQVHVPDQQLKDCLASQQKLSQRFGMKQARILMRRISELFASDCLGDFCALPQTRTRELDGNRRGQIALNLLPALEMIIAPIKDLNSSQQIAPSNWMGATHVNIVDVSEPRETPTPDV